MAAGARGFALVEALVAAIILGVALAAILGLMTRALSSQRQGELLQTAAMLADEQLNLVLARGPDSYGNRFPLRGVCDPPFDTFSYDLSIGPSGVSSAYAVSVTISWQEARGPQNVTVGTRMAPRTGDDPDPDRRPQQAPERTQ